MSLFAACTQYIVFSTVMNVIDVCSYIFYLYYIQPDHNHEYMVYDFVYSYFKKGCPPKTLNSKRARDNSNNNYNLYSAN